MRYSEFALLRLKMTPGVQSSDNLVHVWSAGRQIHYIAWTKFSKIVEDFYIYAPFTRVISFFHALSPG